MKKDRRLSGKVENTKDIIEVEKRGSFKQKPKRSWKG